MSNTAPTRDEKINAALLRIGDRINQRMYDRRWSIVTMAERSGVNRVVIWKIFKGQRYNITSLAALIVALEMDPAEIIQP